MTNSFCLHAGEIGPFIYREGDSPKTWEWGDDYNATADALGCFTNEQ